MSLQPAACPFPRMLPVLVRSLSIARSILKLWQGGSCKAATRPHALALPVAVPTHPYSPTFAARIHRLASSLTTAVVVLARLCPPCNLSCHTLHPFARPHLPSILYPCCLDPERPKSWSVYSNETELKITKNSAIPESIVVCRFSCSH